MTSQNYDISRRRIFQAVGIGTAGIAGASLLSACGDGSKGDGGAANQAAAARKGTFVTMDEYDPNTDTRNMLVTTAILLMDNPVSELLYPRISLMNWGTSEYEGQIAESYELDVEAGKLVLTIRKGLKWTDGADVTTNDVAMSLWFGRAGGAAWRPGFFNVSNIEHDDDTVTVTFKDAFDGIEFDIMKARVHSYAMYGTYFDQAKALAEGLEGGGVIDADAWSAILAEVAEFQPEEFVSCGAYKLIEAGDAEANCEVHEGGLFADQVGFEKLTVLRGGSADALQAFLAGGLDYYTGVFGGAERESLKAIEGLKEFSTAGLEGNGLLFNYGKHEEFKDVRFRQAIIQILDRETVGQIAMGEGGYYVPQYDAGMPDSQVEVLFDDPASELTHYETNHEAATALLEDAGWTKVDGFWHKPNGDKATYEINAPADWNDFILTSETVATQLQEFGFDATAVVDASGDPWGVWNAGNYDISSRQWGNVSVPAWFGSWQHNWFTDNGRTKEAPGMQYDVNNVETEAFGKVDVEEIYAASQGSASDPAVVEANQQLAKIFNETLVRVPVWGFLRTSFGLEGSNVDTFNIDPEHETNDLYVDNPVMISILDGKTKPVA